MQNNLLIAGCPLSDLSFGEEIKLDLKTPIAGLWLNLN